MDNSMMNYSIGLATGLVIANSNESRQSQNDQQRAICAKNYNKEVCDDVCTSHRDSSEHRVSYWKSDVSRVDFNSCLGTTSQPYKVEVPSSLGVGTILIGPILGIMVIFLWIASR